jgi:GAF domain-containing protein
MPKPTNTLIPSSIVETWQQVVDSIADLLSLPSVTINRLEGPEVEVFRSSMNAGNPFPSGTRMKLAGTYCEAAACGREKVQIADARKDPAWVDSPSAKAGAYAYLGYALFWPDGEVFGTICAFDTKENEWGSRYERLLETFRDAIEMHLTLVDTMDALKRKNQELEHTFSEVKTLRGMLPICSACKKIRDDEGYWDQIEGYLKKHSEVEFSHGLCPDCEKRLYADYETHR